MRAIDCRNYLVSTDGSIFHHPDDEAIQCVIANAKPARLFFNYESERTVGWRKTGQEASLGYTAQYPARNGESIEINLLAPTGLP
jgi:hypothetical protein